MYIYRVEWGWWYIGGWWVIAPRHANLDSAETLAALDYPCLDWNAPGYYCHNNYSLETIYELVLN